jgi:GNAT superfamily N-acetyltransferase
LDPNRALWVEAGGNAEHLDIYDLIGVVAPFSDGDGRALATIHPGLPKLGAIGDWVGDTALLTAAEDWLRTLGCTSVRGPMEMCRWFNYRANLGPFDELPFTFEPTHKADRWLGAGYEVASTYVSLVAEHDPQIRAGMDRAAGLAARGWTIQSIANHRDEVSETAFGDMLELVHEIFTDGFADVEGYVPVPGEAIFRFYAPHRDKIDLRLTLLAKDPTGKPAAFLLAIPDDSQPDRGWFQVLTLAVLPEFRHVGIGTWLVAAAHQAGRRAGYSAGIHCFVHTPRGDESVHFHGRIFRRYALLHKEL